MFRDLGVGARPRARFIKRHNHRRRQKLGARPVKMQFSPPGGSNHNTPLSYAVFPKCIYLSRPFSHKSTVIHMYLGLLFGARISLNKAIKAQKKHCTFWIAFIKQAHVKTHVNSSYYFKVWSTQNGVKRIKSIDSIDAYTVGTCVIAWWHVFTTLKKNTLKTSFKNKADNKERLI